MNKYCVYVHCRETDGLPFYVGKGEGKRWKQRAGRSVYWHRIANKYGWTARKIKTNMPEACSFSLERALIAAIGDGLCNLTTGGEGTSGRKPTDAHRIKCSISNKGTKPAPHSIELARLKNSKPIRTACGLSFPSATEAAKFLRPEKWKVAKVNICCAAGGKRNRETAYGYRWSYV